MTTTHSRAFPEKALGRFYDRSVGRLVRSLKDFSLAILDGNPAVYTEARDAFAEKLSSILAASDLMGRAATWREFDAAGGGGTPPFATTASGEPEEEIAIQVGEVPFKEAIQDIIDREPRLAEGWQEVADLYSRTHAFALAKSTDLALTRKIQDTVSSMLKDGFDPSDSGRVIAEMGGWTRAYGETVFRTNAATAFSAGQFQQSQDPEVADLIPAFEYVAVHDLNTRPNHLAAHGLIAGTKDSIWNIFTPPISYNCRCSLRFVDRYELEQRHLLDKAGRVIRHLPATFGAAHPDKGFGMGRPDRMLYMRG